MRPKPLAPLLKPIFLLPLAVTLAAQWADLLGVVEALADLCRAWLALWGEIWDRLFAWLAQWINLRPTNPQKDMLTLAVMLIGTLGLAPGLLRLSPDPVGTRTSMTETLEDVLRMGPKTSLTLCVLLTGLAATVILWPFINAGQMIIDDFVQAMATNIQDREVLRAALAARSDLSLAEHYQLFQLNNPWVSTGYADIGFRTKYPHAYAAGLGGLSAFFGMYCGRGARSDWSLKWNFAEILVTFIFIAIMIAAGAALRALFSLNSVDVDFTSQSGFSILLFFACAFLFGFSVGRSALPMVSVSLLVCSILASDVMIGFVRDVWASAQEAG